MNGWTGLTITPTLFGVPEKIPCAEHNRQMRFSEAR